MADIGFSVELAARRVKVSGLSPDQQFTVSIGAADTSWEWDGDDMWLVEDEGEGEG